ncbi:MAG: hypothetical protein JRF33_06210 [Deltaproteobacteria bacterium]|nr:hypothetical protein [Deltaproteobacteria bacterium]
MDKRFLVMLLSVLFAACAGAEASDDDLWGGKEEQDDTIAYEKQLKQDRIRERQQMSQIAELAAAKREGRLRSEEDVAASMGSAEPPSHDVLPCQENPGPAYRCTCSSGEKPVWVAKAKGPAWKDGGSFLAVAAVKGRKSSIMAASAAVNRATSKIQALRLGVKTDANGYPVKPISGQLWGVESLGVYVSPDGTVVAWARSRADPLRLEPALLKAKCPELDKAIYRCDCKEGRRPNWLSRGLWRAEDGFVYAVGQAPASGDHTEQRALTRAHAQLGRFVSGFFLEASSRKPKGGLIRGRTVSHLQTDKVQFVAKQALPKGGMAVLLRLWVGK